MSSSGGIGGGGGGSRIDPNALPAEVSEATAEVSADVKAEGLTDSSAAQLAASVKAEVKAERGKDGSYEKLDAAAIKKELGPMSVEGGTDIDAELGAWFVSEGNANPYNANTTPDLEAKMKGNPDFQKAVGALTEHLGSQSAASLTEFGQYMKGLQQTSVNIHEILFLAFKESIKETNEDKKYFLQKLKMYNDMGEELSGYLSELVDASRDLGAAAAGAKYPEMVMTAQPVKIKEFDLSTTDANGKLVETSITSKPLERAGLSDTIKEVESMQETVRNKRQMASTAFQNFDQKANQLYNLLSSVMKAMNEMRMGTVRNML